MLEKKLDNLLNCLKDLNSDVRQSAMVFLVKAGETAAIPALGVMADSDPDLKLRYYAKKGLQILKSGMSSPTVFETHGPAEKAEKNNFPDHDRLSKIEPILAIRGTFRKAIQISGARLPSWEIDKILVPRKSRACTSTKLANIEI